MPLVVHLFRLLLLFLNVYETFKILKPLPPSARRGGQPSIRAATQRKRDMKGCLAVWIVWCCFTTYERTFDIIICRLIPFYDEVKSLTLVFLIIARAKGAEPIFLHVIRPIIKPYASTLDSLLDLTRMVGDVLCLLGAVPLSLFLSWWHGFFLSNEELGERLEADADSQRNLTTPDVLSYPPLPEIGCQVSGGEVPRNKPGPRRPVASRRPSANIAQGTVRTRRQVLEAGPKSEGAVERVRVRVSRQASDTSSQHEVWHPPQSSYEPTEEDQEPLLVQALAPLPMGEYRAPEQAMKPDTSSEQPDDEWRQYPPFPSAYPPTPLSTTSQLLAPSSRHTFDDTQFPYLQTIPDNVQQQDFARSLLPPRKPLSPGFLDGSSSDDSSMSGIQQNTDIRSDGAVLGASGVDSEEDEDMGDDFDVTLKTPHPIPATSRIDTRPKASNVTSTSKSSSLSRSTALTTADDGSSLRTRTSFESSTSISTSDSSSVSSVASSLAGRKRTFPRESTRPRTKASERGTMRNVPLARTVIKRTGTRASSHIVTRSQQQILRGRATTHSLQNNDSDGDSDNGGVCDDQIAPGKKRRLILGQTRGPSVYSTRTKIAARERPTMQLAESSRSSTLSVEAPRIAPQASSRPPRRATDPVTDSSRFDLAGPKTVASRRASDKNPTRRR